MGMGLPCGLNPTQDPLDASLDRRHISSEEKWIRAYKNRTLIHFSGFFLNRTIEG